MDLDGFEDNFQVPKTNAKAKGSTSNTFASILDHLDQSWFMKATRSARWMDLVGDYAGIEPFVMDGEALFQVVLDDPLLAIGKDASCTFQILHAYYMLETLLKEFDDRSCNFEIVFWNETKHLTLQTGERSWAGSSRALARSMLFTHLNKLKFTVHVFDGLDDDRWLNYYHDHKPMFLMTNDGGAADADIDEAKAARILIQRIFLMTIISNGIPVALLNGAEHRGSKILTFLYESRPALIMTLKPFGLLANKAGIYLSDCLQTRKRLRLVKAKSSSESISIIKTLQDLDIVLYIKHGVTPEIVYLFIAHSLLLPLLSAQERSQTRQSLPPALLETVQAFLIPLFLEAADVFGSAHHSLEVDGTIFAKLLHFVLSTQGDEVEELLRTQAFVDALVIWNSLGGPSVDFGLFVERYGAAAQTLSSSTGPQHAVIIPRPLLPFNHPALHSELSLVRVSTDTGEPKTSSTSKFSTGVIVEDTRHWHNQKSLLPSHLGGAKARPVSNFEKYKWSKDEQHFMASLQAQAATLTGASGGILQQIFIPSATSRSDAKAVRLKAPHATNKGKKSKKDELLAKIKNDKEVKQLDEALKWWKQQLSDLKEISLSSRADRLTALARNPKATIPEVFSEIELYKLHLILQTWIDDSGRTSDYSRDNYTVSIIRLIRDIRPSTAQAPLARKVLTSVLVALGFSTYIPGIVGNDTRPESQTEGRRLSFSFVKLIDSKTKEPLYPFMTIVEHPVVWQLRLFGEFMDRSMDSKPDGRVAFEPDAWQRKVLDGIDANKSLLVVAPTSAGKTFISFYAMEKVLRESDNGILVYIAPTKPLVNQIAAEVYARFNKVLDGKSCWAIHTREFRVHNPMDCQILVTVPEILAIMLLSPSYAKVWTPRIKRIILDEIHSIGQENGGNVWEQIILLAPCPIIGLSATIGSPEVFSDWLATVQQAHGFDYDFIEHQHRYSHLRKSFYLVDGESVFKNLHQHTVTKRMKFLHPIGLLSFGPKNLPPDLSLEAADTLTLSTVLLSFRRQIDLDLSRADPAVFFPSSHFLRQKDILDYETHLKTILTHLMKKWDPRDTSKPLGMVVEALQNPELKVLEGKTQLPVTRTAFLNDLLTLVADLHVKEQLPAILFSFDRSHCDVMGEMLLLRLENAEKEWRENSVEWERILKQQEVLRKQSERTASSRQRKAEDEIEEDEPSDITFIYPEDPSPQFSFVSPTALYSMSALERDIQKLRRRSRDSIDPWLYRALKRGIAVHHAGMNKNYRSLVENLFRRGFVRVMIATSTLALGINAPTKTSVFCGDSSFLTALMYRQCAGRAGRRGFDLKGNVVFYGLPLDRVQRLVMSRLPSLGGNFPLTSTLALRLLNLLHGSNNAEVCVKAIKSMVSLPHLVIKSPIGREQLLHHLRFSIEYLRRSHLIDQTGRPLNLFSLASHLYYTEPSNFALVELMRSGVLHAICRQTDLEKAKKDFMILMCNLFGRKQLAKSFSTKRNIDMLQAKYPSMIILPPLPDKAQKVLKAHDREILRIFTCYAHAFVMQYKDELGADETLPLSGERVRRHETSDYNPFRGYLQSNAIPVHVRSAFVANSGHDDSFENVAELTHTARAGLHLNGHAIPSMSQFTHTASNAFQHALNAHILDFYIHGQVATLNRANGIRRGDVWYILQDFDLTLAVVKSSLEQFLTGKTSSDLETSLGPDLQAMDDEVGKNTSVRKIVHKLKSRRIAESWDDSSDEGDDSSLDVTQDLARVVSTGQRNAKKIDDADRRVYKVVSAVCEEFREKYKAMWA